MPMPAQNYKRVSRGGFIKRQIEAIKHVASTNGTSLQLSFEALPDGLSECRLSYCGAQFIAFIPIAPPFARVGTVVRDKIGTARARRIMRDWIVTLGRSLEAET
jgi:hypothetical protein